MKKPWISGLRKVYYNFRVWNLSREVDLAYRQGYDGLEYNYGKRNFHPIVLQYIQEQLKNKGYIIKEKYSETWGITK